MLADVSVQGEPCRRRREFLDQLPPTVCPFALAFPAREPYLVGMNEGLILADESATLALGGRIAALLQIGDVIALYGDLGAGKTTLARGILQALGLEAEAPSPTFAIVQPYAPPEIRIPVWHVDLYRLEDPAEAVELGLDEARRDAAMLIEWPERLGAGLWSDALKLQLSIAPQGVGQSAARRLTATVPQAWEARWPPA